MTLSTAVPNVLQDPGFLLMAPIAAPLPTNTVAGGLFTDAWDVSWLPLGATEDGSEFSYASTVSPVTVAEFLDAISYRTTERHGGFAFSLANWGLSNFRRAIGGGVAAIAPVSGSGATALYHLTPQTPGSEVRCMLGWESLDHTVRIVGKQCMASGEVKSAFKKAPANAAIPCNFNFEVPSDGIPWEMWSTGPLRG